jgi:hypothetical protein
MGWLWADGIRQGSCQPGHLPESPPLRSRAAMRSGCRTVGASKSCPMAGTPAPTVARCLQMGSGTSDPPYPTIAAGATARTEPPVDPLPVLVVQALNGLPADPAVDEGVVSEWVGDGASFGRPTLAVPPLPADRGGGLHPAPDVAATLGDSTLVAQRRPAPGAEALGGGELDEGSDRRYATPASGAG